MLDNGDSLKSRQLGAEAEMWSVAKGEVPVRLSPRVEVVALIIRRGVTVGRAEDERNAVAFSNGDATQDGLPGGDSL